MYHETAIMRLYSKGLTMPLESNLRESKPFKGALGAPLASTHGSQGKDSHYNCTVRKARTAYIMVNRSVPATFGL